MYPEHAHALLSRQGQQISGPPWPGWLPIPITKDEYTLAVAYLTSSLILQILAVGVFAARVYTRARPVWRFTIDDWLISVAFALETAMWICGFRSNAWAWHGKRPATLTIDEVETNAMYGAITMPIWAWATGFVKISIAFMLLRFQQSRKWTWFMYLMIGFNIMLVLLAGIWNIFQCIPFASTWDIKGEIPLSKRRCFSIKFNTVCVFITAACNVGSDIVFSLMPLTFLGKIRRPMGEKVVIALLMALGLVASGFSLSKAIVAGRLQMHSVPFADTGSYLLLMGLLSMLEVQTALIAACIPTLRSSTKRLLTRIGLLRSTQNAGYQRYGEGSSISGGPKGARRQQQQLQQQQQQHSPRGVQEMELNNNNNPREMHTYTGDSIRTMDSEEAHYQMDPVTGRITYTKS